MANKEKVLLRKGPYFAVAESNCYALYFAFVMEGKISSQFITNFDSLEDFDYEVDKAEEEIAYLLEEVTS
jgi:hypothetical protein